MGIVKYGEAADLAQLFSLTVREIPVYWALTYLDANYAKCDSDMLVYQDEAYRAAAPRSLRKVPGRLRRKILWEGGRTAARVCWYWDLDG